MVSFAKAPREQLERVAHDQYRRLNPRPTRRPKPRNVRPTLFVLDGERILVPFDGRMYELRPVSFEDGLRLTDLREIIEGMEDRDFTPENVKEYRTALRAVVKLAPKYLVPARGRVRRFLWKLGLHRNPFRDASDWEVGELLGFFLGLRTRSRVRCPST